MILVDTSAWVEYDRATGSGVDRRLRSLITDTDDVAVTEPVMMEVLAGARDDRREDDLRRLLDRFHLLRFDAAVHIEGTVRIYRSCRKVGVTPRGLVGCMIASVAMSAHVPLLAHDRDLAAISRVVDLNLDPQSLTG